MAAEMRRRIAVTPEEPFDDEGRRINALLDSGAFTDVHLRHPRTSLRRMMEIIAGVAPRHHGRLHLHGHFDLTNEFNLGGLHLNRRCPLPPEGYAGCLSASCHTLSEIERCRRAGLSYVTLSPVFDSLSKAGYRAAFTPEELRSLDGVSGIDVIALGGVTPARLAELAAYNFAGYAMLTAAWHPTE